MILKRRFSIRSIAAAILAAVIFAAFAAVPAYAASSRSNPCTSVAEVHAAFPESYWEGLDALLKAHPNWKFIALDTGISWSEAFTNDAEMYPTRNLIQYITDQSSAYYHPSSWFQTKEIPFPDGSGNIYVPFNWAGNSYTVASAPDWIQASEEAIAYCMDPRNFLSEEQVFQFLDQTSGASLEAVQTVFNSVSGSNFWVRSGQESDLYYTDSNNKKVYLTYAEAVYRIAQILNVNPVILASRIVQEQGIGASPLVSGTQSFVLNSDNKTVVSGGYYNYFNIEATDGMGGANYDLIVRNGLNEAYNGGWNTRYKALYGGAEKFCNMYIKKGQVTYYLQKFQVDSSVYGLFWKQYMQAILTPQYEAKKTYNSYKATGALDTDNTFLIPVFRDMPEKASYFPTEDGNPNYKIGSIYVDGKALSGFKTDTTSYTLANVEQDKAALKLNIHAYAGTSSIKVGETVGKGDVTAEVPLAFGDNVIEIVCTAENGSTRIYTLNVYRAGTITYGDINSDGKWDVIDASYIYSHIKGKNILSGSQFECADINGDGDVNVIDVAYIYSYVKGKLKSIPQR